MEAGLFKLWKLAREWGGRNQNVPNFFVPINEREMDREGRRRSNVSAGVGV